MSLVFFIHAFLSCPKTVDLTEPGVQGEEEPPAYTFRWNLYYFSKKTEKKQLKVNF